MHHTGLLPITGTASDLTIRDRHGRPLEPVGHPDPIPLPDLTATPEPTDLDPVDYAHPPGEPMQTKWIDFACNRTTPPEREPILTGSGSRSP